MKMQDLDKHLIVIQYIEDVLKLVIIKTKWSESVTNVCVNKNLSKDAV